jgi:hypothetical protein
MVLRGQPPHERTNQMKTRSLEGELMVVDDSLFTRPPESGYRDLD